MNAANDDRGGSGSDDLGVAYLEARSVTGARYTLLERSTRDRRLGADGSETEVVAKTYCTAYGRLAVVANDDGSFTIVDTQTRLLRTGAAENARGAGVRLGH